MNDRLGPGMREVSRLTRAGRLTEATALLQRMLQRRKDSYSASGTGSVPPTIGLVAETVEMTESGPSFRSGQEFDTGARNRAERAGRADLPEALRRLLDRLPRAGSEPALGGLAEPSQTDARDASARKFMRVPAAKSSGD